MRNHQQRQAKTQRLVNRAGMARMENEPGRFVEPLEPRKLMDATVSMSTLFANDAATSDQAGMAVAVDGDYAVMGSWLDDGAAGTNSGSAYVYRYSGGAWSQVARLVGSDTTADDRLGQAVAIDGDTIVVGAALSDGGVSNSGAAYVFVRQGDGSFVQQAKLMASDRAAQDRFGGAVAISGDFVIVGADREDRAGGNDQGAAYVFRRSGGAWSEVNKLVAPDAATSDWFGRAVDINSSYAVVGAEADDTAFGADSGSVYVFAYNGTSFAYSQKLLAGDARLGANFGSGVALDGTTMVVGAERDDDGGGPQAGAAYVFNLSAGVWSQGAKLLASDGAEDDFFGSSVDISGDRIIVGAMDDDVNGAADAGSAYVFVRTEGDWYFGQRVNGGGGASSFFGVSVGIDGDRMMVGSPFADAVGANDAGAMGAFVFSQPGDPPVDPPADPPADPPGGGGGGGEDPVDPPGGGGEDPVDPPGGGGGGEEPADPPGGGGGGGEEPVDPPGGGGGGGGGGEEPVDPPVGDDPADPETPADPSNPHPENPAPSDPANPDVPGDSEVMFAMLNGATAGRAMVITYADLFGLHPERLDLGNLITVQIVELLGGEMTGDVTLQPGGSLLWTAPADAFGPTLAFSIKLINSSGVSSSVLNVKVSVATGVPTDVDPDSFLSIAGGPGAPLTIVSTDANGRPVLLQFDGASGKWIAIDVGEIGALPGFSGGVQTWVAPGGGMSFAAVSSAGLLLISQQNGVWTLRNLNQEIAGAPMITGAISSFVAGDSGGTSVIAGMTASGDVVIFRSQSDGSWTSENLYDNLRANGFGNLPVFVSTLTSYVTSWNGVNIAGVTSDGDIWTIWTGNGLSGWSASNLSEITGAGSVVGSVTAYLTPWQGINIAGTDAEGNVVVTWWVPSLGGEWQNSDLTSAFGGPRLEASSVVSYVTSWGGLNVVGRDESGRLVAYWWAPGMAEIFGSDQWKISILSDDIPDAPSPAGKLSGTAVGDSISIVGTTEDGKIVRYFWSAGATWSVESVSDLAAA